jgi:hypothetical protein
VQRLLEHGADVWPKDLHGRRRHHTDGESQTAT